MNQVEPPRPWPPGLSSTGGITVRGGVGPSYADLDELRGAARALVVAAERLDDAAERVVAAGRAAGAGAPGSPATARAVEDAFAPLLRGSTSLAAGAERTRELARALLAVADLYGRAEDRAGRLMRVLLSGIGTAAAGEPALAVVGALMLAQVAVLAGALAVGWRLLRGERIPTVTEVVLALPAQELVSLAGGFIRGAAPGWQGATPVPVPGAARTLMMGAAASSIAVPSLRRQPLEVTARLGATTGGPAPATVAELLSDVGSHYPAAGGAPGTVGIERLDHPDGARTWVVAIPGMQTGAFGWGSNPMDNATNVRLMAGAANDGMALVARALEQAGARPGEPLLLAGHSQGGMVAMALAGDPAFRARYRVAAVLTAGSPVATMSALPGVAVLHLENDQDLVPAVDGEAPPARGNRTTAVRDLGASSDPADRIAARDPGAAHDIDTYVRTARAVSAAGAPSVRAWEARAAEVTGGPGVAAVKMEFTGTRLGLNASCSPR